MDRCETHLYDNYVSLGSNCEVGFQLRRVLGGDKATFFNWNITPLPALLSLLRSDFEGVLQTGNIRHRENDLFEDTAYNYALHADFSFPDIHADGLFEPKLGHLRHKTNHLLTRFRTMGERGQTVFFYCTAETHGLHGSMSEVRDLLTRYVPTDRFDVVVAQPVTSLERPFDDGNLHFRQLTRLAPGWDAHDGHVSSWTKSSPSSRIGTGCGSQATETGGDTG